MPYSSEREILHIVGSFEDASISREQWAHAEHVIVALYYLRLHDYETAYEKMKSGIMNLLVNGFKLDLEKVMPYHETLTVFWMRTVNEFNEEHSDLPIAELANELIAACDKDHPLKFYSRDLLYSEEARSRFVEADLLTQSTDNDAKTTRQELTPMVRD